MQTICADKDDQAAEARSSEVFTDDGQSQKVSQGRDATGYCKEEPLVQDTTVMSEYLPELPSFLKTKMVVGKRLYYGGCVCKQHKDVTVYLLDADLWKRFRNEGTEMVITKKGRRVFPVPSYAICELNPEKLYTVTLEITAVDHTMYKFNNGEWVISKESSHSYPTPAPGRSSYLHQFSPNTGVHWMKEPITFSGLKISNNLDAPGTIVLQSMRKYVMSLIISELNGSMKVVISQPETEFVAVTQYQNEKVTHMKIEHNPFANGFRFTSTKSREKPRRQVSQDADSENEQKLDDISSNDLSPLSSPKTLALSNTSTSEIESCDALKLVAYLNKKRQILKRHFPLYFEQLQMESSTDDQSVNPKMGSLTGDPKIGSWPSTLRPSCNTMYSWYDNASDFSGNSNKNLFMFPIGASNPLAVVRQFGKLNQCSDMDLPLSLVKKKKETESQVTAEECFSGNAGIHSKSLTHSMHLTPHKRHHQKKCKMTDDTSCFLQTKLTDVENMNAVQVDSTVQEKSVSTVDNRLSGRGEGILGNNQSVEYEDVTCHIETDVTKVHGELHENKTGCLPHTSTVSYLGPTDINETWHLNQESSKDFRSPENCKSVNLNTESRLQMLTRPEVTLKNEDLWGTTHEVVIGSEGRLMFPFISLSVNKLYPDRYYHIILKLVPSTPWVYNYNDHEWTPSVEATLKQKEACHPHPENPKSGYHWGSVVNFDRLRLSTLKQGKNMLKVQLRRQYLPVVIVKSENQMWEYPLKDATFVTVKIDRSPYELSRSTVHYPPTVPESERISRGSLKESTHSSQMNHKIRTKEATADDPHRIWTFMNRTTQSSPLNLKTRDMSPSTAHQFSPAAWTFSSSPSSSSSLVVPVASPTSALELVKYNTNLQAGKSDNIDCRNRVLEFPMSSSVSNHFLPTTSTSASNHFIPTTSTSVSNHFIPTTSTSVSNHFIPTTSTSASSHFLPTVHTKSEVDSMACNVHKESSRSSTLHPQDKSQLEPAADTSLDC